MLADPNDLAALIVMTLPIGLRRFKSPFNLLLLLLDCYAIWKTSSRGAILALGITLAFYFVVRIEGYTKKALTIAVLVLLVTRISAGLGRESDDLEQSTSSRLNYWKAGINMVMHQPILGVGFMNYPHEFERYAPEIEYEWGERTAHSSWILIMAETGLLGLGLFAAVYYQVLRKAWNLKAIYPELFYSALAYGSAMTFLSHCYTLYPWFISGLIMAGGKTVESHDGQRS
jgi:O-antigen ligase